MNLTPPDGLFRDWIDAYASSGEAPDEMHMAAAVALASTAIGWRAWIGWGESLEPVTVNVVLTGTSATARKTTTANIARRVAQLATQGDDDPALHVRDITHTSSRGLLELVAPDGPSQAQEWERNPPPGHLLVWDEIGSILGKPGDTKGADWTGQTRSTIMQFTGGRHGGIQLGSAQRPAGRCAVSVLGTMTRAELEQRVTHGLITDGFMGRMLLVPYGSRARYLAVPEKMAGNQLDARDRVVRRIRRIIESDPFGEAFDHFTRDAIDLRRTWYEERTRRLDEDARSGEDLATAMQAAHGRLQAAAVKLAVIHAISRAPADQAPTDYQVTPQDVQWGIDFTDLTNREIQSLTASAERSIDEQFAEKIVSYLARKGPTNRSQLLDSVRARHLTRDQKWRVVRALHEEGTVTIDEVTIDKKPADRVTLSASTDNADSPDTPSRTGKHLRIAGGN